MMGQHLRGGMLFRADFLKRACHEPQVFMHTDSVILFPGFRKIGLEYPDTGRYEGMQLTEIL
jgi:hypothetical protein